jgi:hypothetical protein
LGRIVSAYLDLAEERAKRKIPMTMEDWAKRLNLFLEFDDREILQDGGKVTAKLANPMPRVNLKNIALSRTTYLRVTLTG